jgi:hypothetical protein
MSNISENRESKEQIANRANNLRRHVDLRMRKFASDTFRYRDCEFPPKALQARLELSFADMLAKFHAAAVPSSEAADDLERAIELLNLNIEKADWSFQRSVDPEGPDQRWGERTITNDFPSRYSIKSFEAYVTPTGFGLVGFDKYGDSGMVFNHSNHPSETGKHHARPEWPAVPEGTPGAHSVEEMMELVRALAIEVLAEYELPEEQLTFINEVVDEIPTTMSETKNEGTATAIVTAVPRM